MKQEWKRLLVVLCAVSTVISFLKPNIVHIAANFALAMFLLKKGWLSEAVGGQKASGPHREPKQEPQPMEHKNN